MYDGFSRSIHVSDMNQRSGHELHIEDIFQAIRINRLHRVATFLEFQNRCYVFVGGRMFQKSSNIKLVILV